jgi:hypothetical protein
MGVAAFRKNDSRIQTELPCKLVRTTNNVVTMQIGNDRWLSSEQYYLRSQPNGIQSGGYHPYNEPMIQWTEIELND